MDYQNTSIYTVNINFELYDAMKEIITFSLLSVGILGLITNSLNVAVYLEIGFQDNISICFLALSVCDLWFIIISNNSNISKVINLVRPEILSSVDMWIDKVYFYGGMLFDISAGVKTFIAVQRGCCVAFPFHVNRVFTNKNTTMILVCICLTSCVPYILNGFIKVVYKTQISLINGTYYSDGSLKFRNYFNKTAAVCACEILVLFSLIAIVCGMASTSKWRQSLFIEKVNTMEKSKPHDKSPGYSLKRNGTSVAISVYSSHHKLKFTEKQKRVKDKRELRVVKQVALVSAIHLICYTPVAACAISYQMLLDGYLPEELAYIFYLYLALNELNNCIGQINAAINFFIYYTYNSKFKRTLVHMCRALHADTQ